MRLCLLIAALGIVGVAVAQSKPADDKTPPINPDRPDLTNGAGITPVGHPVLEIGYRQTHAGGVLHEWGDGPTLRIGVNERFELRITGPTFASTGSGNDGLEDSGLGFKWLLKDGGDGGGFRKPSYALQAGSTVPLGTNGFGQKRPLPYVTGIVDWDFGDAGDLGGNVSAVEQVGASSRNFTLWQASLSYNHTIRGPLAAYFEGYMLIPTAGNGSTGHFIDGGFQYLLNNDCMLDASVGTQLDLHRQSSYFDLGVSFRF